MYLDPSTGSILVQAVVGGVLGLGTLLKLYWTKLRSMTSRNSGK